MSQINQEQMENLQQFVRELTISSTNQSIIQDNKIYFNHDGKYYRCTMPDQFQQTVAEDYKDVFKVNNLSKYPTERQLREKLKTEQGIDIEELEKERAKIRDEYQRLAIAGASILSHEEEALQQHEIKMAEVEKRLMSCLMEIEEYLSISIQKKSMSQYYRMLASLCTETQINTKEWVPVWEDFSKFELDKSSRTFKAVAAVQTLLLNIRD